MVPIAATEPFDLAATRIKLSIESLYELISAVECLESDEHRSKRSLGSAAPALRRQIVDDIAAVLAEMSREVRTGQASPPGAQGRCHAAAWNETAIPSQINGIDVAANLRKCCLERELASFAAVELRISGLHVAATLAEAMVGRGYRDPPGRRIWPPRILIYCRII